MEWWAKNIKSHFLYKELIFIFIFYVVGDTLTTHYGLKLGHQEYNSAMLQLLNFQHGIYYIFVLKFLYIVMLFVVTERLAQQNHIRTGYYLANVIIVFGVFLTTSNLLVIYTGYNLFQFIGLM